MCALCVVLGACCCASLNCASLKLSLHCCACMHGCMAGYSVGHDGCPHTPYPLSACFLSFTLCCNIYIPTRASMRTWCYMNRARCDVQVCSHLLAFTINVESTMSAAKPTSSNSHCLQLSETGQCTAIDTTPAQRQHYSTFASTVSRT